MVNELEDVGIVSRTYLSVFFMDINNLKDALAGYRSIILRLKIQTSQDPNEIFKGLQAEMKNAVIQWSDSVRHDVDRCMIAAEALKETLKDLDLAKLQDPYEKIINQFTPDLEEVSKFTFEINKLYVRSTIEKMLKKMERFHAEFTS